MSDGNLAAMFHLCVNSWHLSRDSSLPRAYLFHEYFLFFCSCQCPQGNYFFRAVRLLHWFRQMLLPRCLMNGSSNVDETYREYLLTLTDDLIRFWRSKVKFWNSKVKRSRSQQAVDGGIF